MAITAMILAGKPEAHVKEICNFAGMHPTDVDHAGMILRAKRIGTYKSGVLALTDQRLLDLEKRVRQAELALAPQPEKTDLKEMPAEELKKPAKKKAKAEQVQ
jgi:hypothetical protein